MNSEADSATKHTPGTPPTYAEPYYLLEYEDEAFDGVEECFDTREEAEARLVEVEARILAACGTLDRHEHFYISTLRSNRWLRRKSIEETRAKLAAERGETPKRKPAPKRKPKAVRSLLCHSCKTTSAAESGFECPACGSLVTELVWK